MPENDPAAVSAAAGRPSSSARGGKERHAVHTLAGFRVEGVSVGGQEVRSIHWSPYDRVGVVNADP